MVLMNWVRAHHWRILSRTEAQTGILLSLGALIVALLLVNGCGGGMRNSVVAEAFGPTSSFAFVANSGSANISAFAVSTTGTLSPVAGSPFPAGPGAEFMAMDSVHKSLFVSNQNSNSLSAFSVDTRTGILTSVPGSPFLTGAVPHGVAVDPAGKFVFVGNQNDNSVSVFRINSSNGTLTPAP